MKTLIISSIFLLLILLACTDTEREKAIIGTWTGVSWTVQGKDGGYDASSARFTFEEGQRYQYSYNGHHETGDYFISNQQLHTKPDGGTTMMVKIVRLEGDTMVFDMNRGGQAEQLVLLRLDD